MMYDQDWDYYRGLDKREAKVLENKADELTMSCIYVKNCNNCKLIKDLCLTSVILLFCICFYILFLEHDSHQKYVLRFVTNIIRNTHATPTKYIARFT